MAVGGYILMAMSIFAIYESGYLLGIVFILSGGFIAFANNGIQIDIEAKVLKQELGFDFVKYNPEVSDKTRARRQASQIKRR